jgi:hypothetical protein
VIHVSFWLKILVVLVASICSNNPCGSKGKEMYYAEILVGRGMQDLNE